MKYLFFDTETTGLPRNYKASVRDLDNWPRLVQLAWLMFDDDKQFAKCDVIVYPEGFEIPESASSIHGISTERAIKEGIKLQMVMEDFANAIKKADHLIAHNMSFDEKIIGAEFLRLKWPEKLPKVPRFCTMLATVDYCQLPGNYGYKWPKLNELHNKLFGEDFQEQHNAASDIQATVKCFYELKRLNIISI
jgi:DNA polymerase III subunit epsilon